MVFLSFFIGAGGLCVVFKAGEILSWAGQSRLKWLYIGSKGFNSNLQE